MEKTFTYSTEIAAPIDTVWQCLTEPTRMQQWVPGLIQITYSGGQVAEGGTFDMSRKEGNRIRRASGSLPRVRPPEHLTMLFPSKPMDMDVVYDLTPLGPGRTRMDYKALIRPKGLLMTAVTVVFAVFFGKQNRKILDNLKTLAEGQQVNV